MDPKSDQHPGSSLVSFVGSQGFKNPSSPIVLPPKDHFFLPVDSMHSLLDMHGNFILRMLVLDWPSVLCHTNSQYPLSLFNICCWAFSTGNWVHHTLRVHHPWSSFHFHEGFPEGISGSEDHLYTQWLAFSSDLLADALDVWQKHPRSATLASISSLPPLLHNCLLWVPICHERAFWTCILSSAKADSHWLCDGGSLQCQTLRLDGGVSCSGGSGPCGWVSCTHWWPVCFYPFSHERWERELILQSPPS